MNSGEISRKDAILVHLHGSPLDTKPAWRRTDNAEAGSPEERAHKRQATLAELRDLAQHIDAEAAHAHVRRHLFAGVLLTT